MVNPPDSANEVIIFGNPHSGARSGAALMEQLRRELSRRGLRTTLETDMVRLRHAVHETLSTGKLRAIVAAGGDGTAQWVANCTPAETPITILPLGTENLLARYFGLPADPATIADVVCRGQACWMDMAAANERRFLLMLGCGFDAEVVHRLHAARSGHIRHWSYAKPIWQALRTYKYPLMRVQYDEVDERGGLISRERVAHWVFVFNVPAYASGIPFARQADPTDGLLDVCCFTGGSVWRGFYHLATVWTQRHGPATGCVRFRTARLRITAETAVPVQADGDPGGTLPVDVRVVPRALRLLVPPAWTLPRADGTLPRGR